MVGLLGRFLWLVFVRGLLGIIGALIRKFVFKLTGRTKDVSSLLLPTETNGSITEEAKSIIIGTIFFVIFIILIRYGFNFYVPDKISNNVFCCENISGRIEKTDTNIKGMATIYLNSNESYYLGLFLDKTGSKLLEIGDSIDKIQGEMTVKIYRNEKLIYHQNNGFYKPRKCICN